MCRRPSRSNGTSHANPPGATSRPRWTSTSVRAVQRVFELRALDEGARHAEAELTVEAVVGAARQHARARPNRLVRRRRRSSRRRRRSRWCERARRCAVRHRRRGSRRRAPDRSAARSTTAAFARLGVDRRRRCRRPRQTAPRARCRGSAVAGDIEFVEGVETEHAGAVDRHADLRVLFEDDDVVPVGAPATRAAVSPAGPAPMIATSRTMHDSILAAAHFPCALHANPK